VVTYTNGINVRSKSEVEKGSDLGDFDLDNNWYLYAVTLFHPATKVGHFPQGQGGPVVMPFIFANEIEFNLSWFEKWESDELPDPLRMYKLE
jgi:hypothetical protein